MGLDASIDRAVAAAGAAASAALPAAPDPASLPPRPDGHARPWGRGTPEPTRIPARPLAYLWALPTTAVGLLAFALASMRGRVEYDVVEGVLEVHGGLITCFLTHCTPLKGGASAMTLGHVVLGRDATLLDLTREHERVHVRQCERWGPLFLPAYLTASLVVALRRGRPYEDNPFEREAFGLVPRRRRD